jgi:hypothetical protein
MAVDDILAELNGLEGVSTEQLDRPMEQGPSPADLMRATATKTPVIPGTRKMDSQHSIQAGGDGYRVTVAGTYYVRASDGKSKDLRNYELQFNLPHLYDPKTEKGALGIIVGKMLLPALKRHYPGALGYRTHEILKAEPLTPSSPPIDNLQYMDLPALQAYATLIKFPFTPAEYWDAVHLREDLFDFKANPKDFAKRREAKHKVRLEEKELFDMNPELRDNPLNLPTVTPSDPVDNILASL